MIRKILIACALPFALAGMLGASEWALHPSADKGQAKEYRPTFEKHFEDVEGVLKGRCALGADFYKAMEKSNVFVGTGPLWATRTAWPTDAADFDFTVEYQWFQKEPMEQFGDFPDLKLGFRLDANGAGYYLTWGMLGQVLIKRLTPEGRSIVVAHGTLPGRKSAWWKLRVRAAGPILKAKIWRAEKPEPATWTAEGFDDWSSSPETLYKQGAIAVGFAGRKLFDTCVYEYRNPELKILTAEEKAAERSFDPQTMPAYTGRAKGSDTTLIKMGEPAEAWTDEAALNGWEKDANLKVSAGPDGLVLSSSDGKPAYAWRKTNTKLNAVRAKSAGGARALLALKGTASDGQQVLACLDPIWREGLTALLYQDAGHTSGAYAFTWKQETWYDLVSLNAHWHKWQIIDPAATQEYAAFSSGFVPGGAGRMVGVGVAGTGSVTVRGVTSK
ncbi:MAG: hypothetical protein HS116_14115 [Planctomycetes bacterium]|nr:hypothetical protein [Planctomycetota bacterium]